MGDIYEAYKHLNETFDLGLDAVQMYAAEATFTSRYAEVSQFPAELREDTDALMADWEFKAHLVPRQGEKISDEQRRRMQEELEGMQDELQLPDLKLKPSRTIKRFKKGE